MWILRTMFAGFMGVDLFLTGATSGMLCSGLLTCTFLPKIGVKKAKKQKKKKKSVKWKVGRRKESCFKRLYQARKTLKTVFSSLFKISKNARSKDASSQALIKK